MMTDKQREAAARELCRLRDDNEWDKATFYAALAEVYAAEQLAAAIAKGQEVA